ncbi:MAG: hypothetical protein LBD10_07455 [Desulfobulbus sp.]|jgi:hypothetical protein|uniref:P22 phage major capsid protein family protein n=1 Tax=Desulfobulbus sp. TaxID=895 RepID=UPI002851E434|nr:P22 phage major capsid protein family protein [Desulfobulbus sp.]MDR2550014.1 hypothetical protein [Desulfobulbus sp.]
MANTLTGLIDYIYQSADVVSREMVGMIPSVYINGVAEQTAVNQEITYDVVPTMTAEDTVPGATPPELSDQAVGTGTMQLTKSKTVRFYWSGEDEAGLGTKRTAIENNKFAQAFRTLTNQIEADLAALYMHASRAYGTPGTTPFGVAGDFTDAAQAVRILKDNGAPTSDIQLVINTAAGTNIIGKQARADIIGASVATLQQQGVLLDIAGAKIRESAQIRNVAKGTGAAYQINNAAGYAAGAIDLALDTGSGTVNAGDVVTFNGDLNKYVVGAALSGGSLALNAPGLVQALADDAVMAIGNSYAANMCFDRSAIHLLARLPKVPEGGDQADDEMIMIDPVSGLPFRVALYRGYMANQFAIQMAWGVKAVKPAHISLLLG